MSLSVEQLQARVEDLDRRLRRTRRLALGCAAVTAAVLLGAAAPKGPDVLRVRGLVVVDDKGRERVVLGAPIPDRPGARRVSPAAGLAVYDPAGLERFGVGLLDDGRMAMGFDAPKGKGDDRNRERITLEADAEGGATLRFLNRKTFTPGRLRLGEDDRLWLEFLDVRPDKVVRRRLGFTGQETVEEKR
jgi:hypothetical protein